eukprot:6202742-Pleurochrysis_carterae.AAC.2
MLDTQRPTSTPCRFQVGIATDYHLCGAAITVSQLAGSGTPRFTPTFIFRFWLIVNLTSHGAPTAARPHCLRQRAGRVSTRDPTAVAQRTSANTVHS